MTGNQSESRCISLKVLSTNQSAGLGSCDRAGRSGTEFGWGGGRPGSMAVGITWLGVRVHVTGSENSKNRKCEKISFFNGKNLVLQAGRVHGRSARPFFTIPQGFRRRPCLHHRAFQCDRKDRIWRLLNLLLSCRRQVRIVSRVHQRWWL